MIAEHLIHALAHGTLAEKINWEEEAEKSNGVLTYGRSRTKTKHPPAPLRPGHSVRM